MALDYTLAAIRSTSIRCAGTEVLPKSDRLFGIISPISEQGHLQGGRAQAKQIRRLSLTGKCWFQLDLFMRVPSNRATFFSTWMGKKYANWISRSATSTRGSSGYFKNTPSKMHEPYNWQSSFLVTRRLPTRWR